MRFLLDTCTFIWLAMPQNKLSPLAVELLDEAGHEWFLSDVSLWEVVMKHSSGKLPLPGEPREWLPSQVEFHRLGRLTLHAEEIYLSGELPRVYADPFDRLLAAQAITQGMTILSPDTPLSLLGASRMW
jgi:PIN domain nuclease of toxin-antitoxin system